MIDNMKAHILEFVHVVSRRLKYSFKPLTSPTPMMPPYHFDPQWNLMERPASSNPDHFKKKVRRSFIYYHQPKEVAPTIWLT